MLSGSTGELWPEGAATIHPQFNLQILKANVFYLSKAEISKP